MLDSFSLDSPHLAWIWAIAAAIPLTAAIRTLRRSGRAATGILAVAQLAIAISFAVLGLAQLNAAWLEGWLPYLRLPGTVIVPLSVLIVALEGSSRVSRSSTRLVLLATAAPALASLGAVWAGWIPHPRSLLAEWLTDAGALGSLASLRSLLPITYGVPCLLAAMVLFLHECAHEPGRGLRQTAAAGAACATPILATVVCAVAGGVSGLEWMPGSFLITSAALGWLLVPGRSARTVGQLVAIDSLAEAVIIIDDEDLIVDANSNAMELLGIREGDLRGRPAVEAVVGIPELGAMLAEPSRICGEFFTGTTASSRRCHEVRVHVLEDGELQGSRVLSIRDITANRVAEDRLFYQAHFDSLTGLANRRFFLDKISTAIDEANSGGHQVALMYLDLDGFKEVNDSLGHAEGDELLRIMAHRLRQHLRSSDTLSRDSTNSLPEVSRIGGDEFAVLMARFGSLEDVAEVAKRILGLVSDPVTIGDQCLRNGCTIGIAIYPQDGEEIGTLVKNADAALYYAKKENRGQFEFFRSELGSNTLRTASLEKQLRGAIEANEFVLHYQPKVDLARQVVVGAEALLRWENPEIGTVPPKEFIPVAEESGLITTIGAWVIETACAQIQAWSEAGYSPLPISVNVSCQQFTRMDLQQVVVTSLDRHHVLPRQLELELTESAILEDNEHTASCLRELRAIGVPISLDDFGTGYSSLSYLNRMPLDVLKMDRAFIRDVHSDPSAAGVTSAVVAMAHSLDLRVVAEGVDCVEQLAILRRMGCDLIQGFIYSAALPAQEFAKYLPSAGGDSTPVSIKPALPASDPLEHDALRDAPCEVKRATGDEPALKPETERSPARYALIVDDQSTGLGPMAMRMNQMGIPSFYARDPDEGVLFAAQEPDRIHALFVSSETSPQEVDLVAHQIAALSMAGEQPSIVVVGEELDPETVASLRRGGSIWSLQIPFDDAELSFVVDAALSPPGEASFRERNRAPFHLMAWTRVGKLSGHGVLSSLSPRGGFIEMDEPLEVGTTFQLEFTLSDWPVSLQARVAYVNGNGPNQRTEPSGIGVVFLGCDRETGDRIQEEVEKRAVRYVA